MIHFVLHHPSVKVAHRAIEGNTFGIEPGVAQACREQFKDVRFILDDQQLGRRLLALTGYRIATTPEQKVDAYAAPEEWLLRLGGAVQAA